MTLRMPCGGGIYGGQTHSQSIEAMFTQVCGLRTVMPSVASLSMTWRPCQRLRAWLLLSACSG